MRGEDLLCAGRGVGRTQRRPHGVTRLRPEAVVGIILEVGMAVAVPNIKPFRVQLIVRQKNIPVSDVRSHRREYQELAGASLDRPFLDGAVALSEFSALDRHAEPIHEVASVPEEASINDQIGAAAGVGTRDDGCTGGALRQYGTGRSQNDGQGSQPVKWRKVGTTRNEAWSGSGEHGRAS